jgi:lysosomal acid lipase/cholesteryl ester hydrolase
MGLAAFTKPEIVKMISSAALLCPISYLNHVSASFVLRAVAMHLDQVIYYAPNKSTKYMPVTL